MNENKINKSGSIVKLVIWSVVGVILISVFSVMMVADGLDIFSVGGFSILGGDFYSDGESYNVGDKRYYDEIKEVDISWDAGGVEIRVWDGEFFKLTEDLSSNKEKDLMRSKVEDGVLTVKFAASGLRWFSHTPSKTLTLYIPKSAIESFKSITVNSASASIRINGGCTLDGFSSMTGYFDFGSIDVGTASGEVTVTYAKAEELNVDTASGSISLVGYFDRVRANTASGDISINGDINNIDVDTVSGEVDVDAKVKNINLDSVSGNISIKTLNGYIPDEIDASTVSGDVNLTLSDTSDGFKVHLDSTSGKIKCGSAEYTKYTNGKGLAQYYFETVSGDIIIVIK